MAFLFKQYFKLNLGQYAKKFPIHLKSYPRLSKFFSKSGLLFFLKTVGYNIFDLPIGELAGQAFDGSSIAQMASYGTSFLNKMLVDTEGVPRECKYFVLYTNDLSENRIQFKYDASGNNAGIFCFYLISVCHLE